MRCPEMSLCIVQSSREAAVTAADIVCTSSNGAEIATYLPVSVLMPVEITLRGFSNAATCMTAPVGLSVSFDVLAEHTC